MFELWQTITIAAAMTSCAGIMFIFARCLYLEGKNHEHQEGSGNLD